MHIFENRVVAVRPKQLAVGGGRGRWLGWARKVVRVGEEGGRWWWAAKFGKGKGKVGGWSPRIFLKSFENL